MENITLRSWWRWRGERTYSMSTVHTHAGYASSYTNTQSHVHKPTVISRHSLKHIKECQKVENKHMEDSEGWTMYCKKSLVLLMKPSAQNHLSNPTQSMSVFNTSSYNVTTTHVVIFLSSKYFTVFQKMLTLN